MAKITYEPEKNNKEEKKVEVITIEPQEETVDERYSTLVENIESVKPVGDVDCDYIMYLEDYVYTYIYQYGALDAGVERAAVVVGKYYPESKESIICGILPVSDVNLRRGEDWLNNESIDSILVEKEKYFPDTIILGWLHMQPGYGTMPTSKELKIQEELFGRDGSLLLLVDPVNKIETFYTYENNDLKEQTGYYIYYDKNACMQKYMLDNPFIRKEKERADDVVVTKFRERGNRRKKEYEQKQKANVTVVAACVGLLAIAAVIAARNQPDGVIPTMNNSSELISDSETRPLVSENGANFTVQVPELENDNEGIEVVEGIVTTEDLLDAIGGEESVDENNIQEEENNDNYEKDSIIEDETIEVVEENSADEGDYLLYTVKSGDTIRKISYEHYQTELRTREIIELNKIENGDFISPGQVLKLPVE